MPTARRGRTKPALPAASLPATPPRRTQGQASVPPASSGPPSSGRLDHLGAAAELRVKERALQIYQDGRDAQPEGTKRMYAGKQREYIEWCDQQDFATMTR